MNKIEDFLINSLYSYQEIGENMWLLDDAKAGFTNIALAYSDPLIVVSVEVTKLDDIAPEKREAFFQKLLELNTDLLHGAYAVQGNDVILIDTLEYAWTQAEELRATLDAFSLALSQHYGQLAPFRKNTPAPSKTDNK
jgi:hypothetical protein